MRQSVVQVSGKHGSLGSGVVVAPEQIVTNAHVIPGSEAQVEDWDGNRLSAVVTKMNRSRDLALLSVRGIRAAAIPLGDSISLSAGTPVFAVGNPLGFVGAISSGVVHQMRLPRWICADVQLAPGNSGGPLCDFKGQVVGINTMVARGRLALAVPSRSVAKFLKHQDARNLGVLVRGVRFRGGFGILLIGVAPASAAEHASLLPGDILTGANGFTFSHADDLTDAIDSAADGLLRIEFFRGDGKTHRQVTADLTRLGVRTAA